MLVVSRKENQSVVFPSLGITVEILRVAGKAVRVGVRAPDEIRVLRGELVDSESYAVPATRSNSDQNDGTAKAMHDLRNRLNKAQLAMTLLEKQLAAGRMDDAEASLALALKTFDEMDQAAGSASVAQPGVGYGVTSEKDASDAPTGASETSVKPKRALLVEDDPNERMLLASYLRASGYDVDTAEDGQAALDYLSKQKPDAVVMDMEMPRLNGRDAIQEIRRDEQFDDMKVFVVSGMAQKAMNVPSGDRGVQRWFQKPLSPDDLVDELSGLN